MDDFDARRASLDLVTAFVNNHKLSATELPILLADVFRAISGFDTQALESTRSNETVSELDSVPASANEKPAEFEAPVPGSAAKIPAASAMAVSIEDSLADPNVIVSLITGEKFKMLKRHLGKHGLTEAEYRQRFNLPDDYPMVAPAYSKLRREVATKMHASAKNEGSESQPAEALGPEPVEQAPEPVKAKAVSAKTASRKKSVSSRERPGAGAAGPVKAAERKTPVETPAASDAAGDDHDASPADTDTIKASPTPLALSERAAEPDSGKTDNATNRPAAKKPARKRRMARQPAAEKSSIDAAAKSASVEVSKAAAAAPAAAKPAARKPRKAKVRTSSPEDGAKAKPVRKERKRLSPVFS